jgi:ABC-type multidrug transport system fused ATPase/permease subunit
MVDVYSQAPRFNIQSADQLEAEANGLIRLKDATFAWGQDTGNKNIINFKLTVPDVTFAKGKINLITGPTGSGKSSFLKALTGELHFEPKDDSSFFHLPREGGVSFAAQESWCMSDSIKDNILFGAPYDEARYRQVLHDCALETDLKLFDDGDLTEIGERGVTLSGGQKARITLARAIYANTSVVLLDGMWQSHSRR